MDADSDTKGTGKVDPDDELCDCDVCDCFDPGTHVQGRRFTVKECAAWMDSMDPEVRQEWLDDV